MDLQLTAKTAPVTGASRRSAWPSCATSAEDQSYLARKQAEARPRLDAPRSSMSCTSSRPPSSSTITTTAIAHFVDASAWSSWRARRFSHWLPSVGGRAMLPPVREGWVVLSVSCGRWFG